VGFEKEGLYPMSSGIDAKSGPTSVPSIFDTRKYSEPLLIMAIFPILYRGIRIIKHTHPLFLMEIGRKYLIFQQRGVPKGSGDTGGDK